MPDFEGPLVVLERIKPYGGFFGGEGLIGQKWEDAPKGFNFATKTLDVFLFLQHHRIGILHGVPPENDGDGIVFYPQKSGLAIVNYRLAREMPRE